MFRAERHTSSSPQPEKNGRPNYEDRLKQAAHHHRFPDLPPSQQTLHSDLFKDMSHFLYGLQKHGRQTARQEIKKMLSGNLLSIAKEMKGMQWMQTAFKVRRQGARTLFQRSEFKGGDDLRTYSTQVDETITNPAERARFLKENLQMVEIFDRLEAWVADLEWSDDPAVMIDQLTTLPDGNHFVEDTLPITKELQILFPSLKTKAGRPLQVYVSRPLVSVSPPSSVHLKRQTSLAWVNRLVYIPDLKELVMIRDGIFSGYDDAEIAEFLTLDENWPDLAAQEGGSEPSPDQYFQTEEELLAFIAALPEEYKQKHAHAILDEVIQRLGGFKPAPKITNVSDELTIDIEAMAEALLDIFEWELLTYGQDEVAAAQVSERLNYLKDIFLHHLATDTAIEWQLAIDHYQTFFGQRHQAVNPEEHFETAQRSYAQFYPELSRIRVDLSLLDCGVGSIVGGFRNMDMGRLQVALGKEGLSLLRRYAHQPIRTEEELKEFCRQFGKDYRRFNKQGECQICHHHTFLGECDVCPVCEVKDDLGISSWHELAGMPGGLGTEAETLGQSGYDSTGSTTLGVVVASFATPDILLEQYWPTAA